MGLSLRLLQTVGQQIEELLRLDGQARHCDGLLSAPDGEVELAGEPAKEGGIVEHPRIRRSMRQRE